MVTLRISDMTCGHCASAIARALSGVDKGARIEVDMPQKLLSISSTAPDSELMQAIQDLGYTPEKVAVAPTSRPKTGAGCGCGCGPRAAPPVDVAQSAASQARSCCA